MRDNQCWRGCRQGNPHALSVVTEIDTATMENIWSVLKKLKWACDPATPCLVFIPNKRIYCLKEITCTLMVSAVLFTITKT